VGGVLTEVASWRWVLFINIPFGLAAVLLAPRYVREPERHPARLDLPGAITATAGVAGVVYALIRAASNGWSDPVTVAVLVAGVALLGVFLLIEVRTREPLLPLRLFADRNRAAGFGNFFLGPASMMSMFFFLTQFLQDVRGFGALRTGFAFLPMAVGMFAMTRVIPHLLPRFGPKPLAMTGSAVMIAGLVWLTRLNVDSAYFPAVFGPMVVLGLGGGLGFVPLNPIIMSTVAPKDAGAAGGTLQTMQQVGSSLGLAVLVTVFGSAARRATSEAQVGVAGAHHVLVAGMTAAFTASAVIALGTFVIASTFRSTRGRPS
jgi:MFS family permease